MCTAEQELSVLAGDGHVGFRAVKYIKLYINVYKGSYSSRLEEIEMRKDLTGPSSAPGWREEVVMAQRCCYHVGVLPAGDVCTRGR